MSIEKKTMLPNDERLIDFSEAARISGNVSDRTIRRLIAAGELPKPVKILTSPRFYYSDILAYLERLKTERERGGF